MKNLIILLFIFVTNFVKAQFIYDLVYEPKDGIIRLTKTDYENNLSEIEIDDKAHFKDKILNVFPKDIKQDVLENDLDFYFSFVEKLNIDNQFTAVIVKYLIVYPMPDQGQPITTNYNVVIYNKNTPVFSYPFTYTTSYEMVSDMPSKPQNDYSTGTISKNGNILNVEIKKPKINDYTKGTITELHQISLVNGKWQGKFISKK